MLYQIFRIVQRYFIERMASGRQLNRWLGIKSRPVVHFSDQGLSKNGPSKNLNWKT